jgi:phage terminase small subunit
MPGRKPKPTALKILHGTFRPDRATSPEPTSKPSSGRCPRNLDGEAKVLWHRLAPELRRLGMLTRLNEPWLEATCVAYARMREEPRASTLQAYKSLLAEGGLTPSSLSRIHVPKALEGDAFGDAFEG